MRKSTEKGFSEPLILGRGSVGPWNAPGNASADQDNSQQPDSFIKRNQPKSNVKDRLGWQNVNKSQQEPKADYTNFFKKVFNRSNEAAKKSTLDEKSKTETISESVEHKRPEPVAQKEQADDDEIEIIEER